MKDYCTETSSPVFQKTLAFCKKVADSDANILLIGESGTGKEMAARYIHQLGKRQAKNFVAVNCSAYTETLLESELFGHEQGAFTGATKFKAGKLESAHEGTLFLDEIGDTNPTTQTKLLRVIETKQVERVGSNLSRHIDFRLISATNADLNKAIRTAGFREDFFYRVSTVVIRIPALRERMEDLSMLISFFLEKSQAENRKTIRSLVPEVEQFLYEYDYPGNVRELKNIIDRMVILSEDGVITGDCLPILYSMNATVQEQEKQPLIGQQQKEAAKDPNQQTALQNQQTALQNQKFQEILPFRDYKRQTEACYLEWVLQQTGGNVAEAARKLGMSRRQFFNKINEYQIKK